MLSISETEELFVRNTVTIEDQIREIITKRILKMTKLNKTGKREKEKEKANVFGAHIHIVISRINVRLPKEFEIVKPI